MTEQALPRFGFDTVFNEVGATVYAPPRPKRMFSADEVEVIRLAAFAEGERSVVALAETATAAALSQVAGHAGLALGALQKVAHDHRVASAELALAAARKIADSALERFPEAPVAAALSELARELEAAPKLKVRVAPDLIEQVQAALERAAQACGFAGAIVVTGDPAMPPAAFILDWGDGRAAFDPQAAAARVAAAVDEALASEGLHAEPLISTSEADHG